MDVREKLVELLGVITCPNTICNFCEHFQNKIACERHKNRRIAAHEHMEKLHHYERGTSYQQFKQWRRRC